MSARLEPPLIAIVLATYNGSRYLTEQLASLWAQSCQDFEVIVRDDGSVDNTRELLSREAARRPGRLRIIEDEFGRLGPKKSFGLLLQHSRSRWVAFCDQDDSWLPGKLETQLRTLQGLEALHGSATPLLCCSDAVVTDSALRVLQPSYFAEHRFEVAGGRDLVLPRLLFRNYAIGTTVMINKLLADHCQSIPDAAVMHDWWCALVACLVGKSAVLRDPQVRYRQHAANTIGSRRHALPRSAADWRATMNRTRENSARCLLQAQALYRASKAFPVQLASEDEAVLEDYARFGSLSPLTRAMTLLRNRSFKPGFANNGLHLYTCATAPL
jgi:hypothetical protein